MINEPVISYFQALRSLVPDAKLYVEDNDWDRVNWSDEREQPSKAEVDAEVVRLQANSDAQAYSRKREAEYPSVQECVHAILDDQLDALQAKRALIKTKYPKGG
jgi:hypothetical protein